MTHDTHEEHKHVAHETAHQRFIHRCFVALLELSSLELIVGTLHLLITAAAVFGIVGAGGDGGH